MREQDVFGTAGRGIRERCEQSGVDLFFDLKEDNLAQIARG
ncbi:MAG: hypothetical protein ABI837_07070 [Acidobacteriota bacterium]